MGRWTKAGCFTLSALAVLLWGAFPGAAQTAFPEDSIVRQRCSACHKLDEKGKVEVIEETRKSPEEWKAVILRMVRLNDAPLEDGLYHPAMKELSRHLGLAPEEMAQVAYYNSDENSQYREVPQDDLEKRIFAACVRCHTYGKIASHRMTPAQWTENRNMHLGHYPTTVPQMREMDWPKESEALVEHLSKKFPFEDPRWLQWMEARREQDLTGTWKVAGYQPGMGYYYGTYTFAADSAKGEDEYLVKKRVRYLDGTRFEWQGRGTLYGEYHLRYALAPTPMTGRVEGVFDLDQAKGGFQGKWWTVVQDTNAYGNEAFFKTDGEPKVFAAFPRALQAAPGVEQSLTLVGVGLPESVAPEDIAFSGPGVKVRSVEAAGDSTLSCMVEVGDEAPVGTVQVSVKEQTCEDPLTIFDKLDGIRVYPALGRARVSCGAAYPPHGVQFVARGVHFGPDGKADTQDDLVLEPVDAKWWLEEEKTREGDDDLKYLKAPVANGLYTPVTTYGPIPSRKQKREGVGLIAVGASVTVEGKELKGRSLLAVTEPDFITHIK